MTWSAPKTYSNLLAFREDNPSSIVQCISKARENARTIRDRIREMFFFFFFFFNYKYTYLLKINSTFN